MTKFKFLNLILIFVLVANLNLAPNAFAQTINSVQNSNAQNSSAQRVYNREAGETPSKLPVPRWVSLRFNVVNGRTGPDSAYPVRWVYRQRGLPVRVVAETEEWRRIEDPDGAKVWVHKRMLEAKRTAITRPIAVNGARQIVNLYRDAEANSRIIATLNAGVIGEIVSVAPGWRRIKTGRYTGWVRANELWGA